MFVRACVCRFFVVSLHAILDKYAFVSRISMRSLLVVIGLVGAAILLLSVGVIFRKDHSFRSQHIHQNQRMKEDGIHCSTAQDKEMRRKAEKKMRI